jgi:CRISPR-associated endonuclease Csn1
MTKILGLDLGTNSIGWAIVEKDGGEQFKLIEKGVRIFQEGVKIEKGIEGSKAAERTGFRSTRRIKFRRKLRKIEVLKVLSTNGFCPPLTIEELDNWRFNKKYPKSEAFKEWYLTNEEDYKSPYYYRYLAVSKLLNLNKQKDRYILGRALYHMTQRRGFLSNRLEGTKESEGAVKKEIAEISQAKGEKTLGHFFWNKIQLGEKVRDTYTHREDHYLEEFNRICDFQKIEPDLKAKLFRAIFFQRPLKSQKGLIGKCVFETNKQRCSASRPEYEEYRMLCFINNIKIKTPYDEKLRFLGDDEKEKIKSLFYRKSKNHFDFEDIAKKLAPKNQFKYFKDSRKSPEDWLFNYQMSTSVSGCPISARLIEIFGHGFMDIGFPYVRESDRKEAVIDINDIWHVLYTFESDEKLRDFADKRLKLTDEQIDNFISIRPTKEFASLSLKAICKIIPWLRKGLIYAHAVFLANMEQIIPHEIWNNPEDKELIIKEISQIINTQNEDKAIREIVNGLIKTYKDDNVIWSEVASEIFKKELIRKLQDHFGENSYKLFPEKERFQMETSAFELFSAFMKKNMGRGEFVSMKRIDERIKEFLTDNFALDETKLQKLYHPSAIDVYKPLIKKEDGSYYLGSPMVSSIRNPMAMRGLHQLRKVINEMIRSNLIDENTKLNIELARDLMNANERKAYQAWQRGNESKRKDYAAKIKEHLKSGDEPSENDILKYQLWEEQNHKCIYTGNEIAIHEFLSENPKYDIEHTIPRSVSFDNSQKNKTLCDNEFNRKIKRNKVPASLANHADIVDRIQHWKDNYESLHSQMQVATRQAKNAIDKDSKDKAIQKRHRLRYEYDYWKSKHSRFLMNDVPTGFKNSQIVDTGIITKYARLYLKTYFNKVYTVKGNTVADFRKIWGLQEEYEKKARINHAHHCIDAITIACITKENYENLAAYYHKWEEYYQKGVDKLPPVEKPWPTFTQDVKKIEQEILVSHYTPDVFPKQSKKKLRKRGRIQYSKNGEPVYLQGDSVRGSLHQQTFYGAIEQEVQGNNGETEKKIRYVVRKKLEDIEDSNLKNIVDPAVKEIVTNARIAEKSLRQDIETLKKRLSKAEEKEETEIKAEIAKIESNILNLYVMPNRRGAPIQIKKARVFTPVTNPLQLKEHRDKSRKIRKPHKEHLHVANDGNYLMAIYEGIDKKGNIKRDFEVVNRIDAGQFFKFSVQKVLKPQGLGFVENLVPNNKTDKNIDLQLKAILKIGKLVILWEKSPDEIWELANFEIRKRLYKIIGLSNQRIVRPTGKIDEYATIVLRFHQTALPSKDLKIQDGKFQANEEIKQQRKLNHNQFNALVEGVDFTLNSLGELRKIKK